MIPLFKVFMAKEAGDMVKETLMSGMITQSTKVDEFEELLKKYFNYPYIITVNSATSGLTLAYRLLLDELKIGEEIGEEIADKISVCSTPLTCFATNSSILSNNLDIKWIDIDEKTCNMDLEKLKLNHTKYKICTFVHWGGNPIDIDKLKILKEEGYQIVEDCAHAFGAEWEGKKIGTFGNIAVFSFQAIKHLTTGDGGIILLPNKKLYDRAKLLRWFGIDRTRRSVSGQDFRLEPNIPEYGYKFHMNDINATIGIANFPYIDKILEKHRKNGKYYDSVLKNINGIKLLDVYSKANPSYWIYTLRILNGKKMNFINYMKEKGIMTSQVHARNDTHSCVNKYKCKLPVLDSIIDEIVSIPVGWWITNKERDYIVNCISFFFSDINFISNTILTSEYNLEKDIQISLLTETEFKNYKDLLYQMNGYTQDVDISRIKEMNEQSMIYILRLHNKIIGTCRLLIEKKLYSNMGHIEDVVIDSAYRSKGYGKYLIKFALLQAKNTFNCYKTILSCKDELGDFYDKCGLHCYGKSYEFR